MACSHPAKTDTPEGCPYEFQGENVGTLLRSVRGHRRAVSLHLCGGVQHGLDEDAVAPGGVVDRDMGHGAYQVAVLDNGAAGHE